MSNTLALPLGIQPGDRNPACASTLEPLRKAMTAAQHEAVLALLAAETNLGATGELFRDRLEADPLEVHRCLAATLDVENRINGLIEEDENAGLTGPTHRQNLATAQRLSVAISALRSLERKVSVLRAREIEEIREAGATPSAR